MLLFLPPQRQPRRPYRDDPPRCSVKDIASSAVASFVTVSSKALLESSVGIVVWSFFESDDHNETHMLPHSDASRFLGQWSTPRLTEFVSIQAHALSGSWGDWQYHTETRNECKLHDSLDILRKAVMLEIHQFKPQVVLGLIQ